MVDESDTEADDDAEADAEAVRRAADAIEEVGVKRLTDLIVEAAREAPEGFDPDQGDDDDEG